MSIAAVFDWIEARSQRCCRYFVADFDEAFFLRTVEFLRITFALVMALRYLRTLDALFLFPQMSAAFVVSFVVLYIFLALGLLTPVVLLALTVMEGMTPLFIAVKINAILPLMFLLLGAGRTYSVDNVLWKKPLFAGLRNFAPADFMKIRLYLLLPYALLCALAFLGHLRDADWRSGAALSQLLGNPAISQIPTALRTFLLEHPVFLTGMSHLQLGWELLMLPALFFPWPLALAGLYGLGFFAASYFVLNLSSLGSLEAIYWVLIFHQELYALARRVVRGC